MSKQFAAHTKNQSSESRQSGESWFRQFSAAGRKRKFSRSFSSKTAVFFWKEQRNSELAVQVKQANLGHIPSGQANA
jgi:hypothetical protein